MRKSELEETLALQLRALKIPFEREYRFHPKRKWRFDFIIQSTFIAVEVEGGIWMKKGGHTTGVGFEKDCEKYNEAALMGWTVLRFSGNQVKSGFASSTIERALKYDKGTEGTH